MVEITKITNDKGDESEAAVGNIARTLVIMCAPDTQGRLHFAYDRLLVQGAPENQWIQVEECKTSAG